MSDFRNPCFDDCEFEPECCDFEPICPVRHSRVTVLESISLVPQVVTTLLAVPFDTNLVNLGNGILHNIGGTDFNLLAPGIYRVTFTGSVTPAGEGTTTAGVALAINGLIIPGTTVTETVVAGDIATLATQAIIQVLPFITTVLRVVNPTIVTETFTNPNIIIEKIE